MSALHVEPAAWLALVAATAGYAVGVRRLASRGVAWPRWRSAAFAGAVATVLVATTSPLPANAASNATEGAVAQVILLIVAPLLLAWAAPHTLAVEAGSGATARRVRALAASATLRVLTHPVGSWILYAGSLAVLYLTSLYTLAAHHEFISQPVQLALLVIGCLFLWPIFAAEPLPRRLHPVPAMGYMLALLPYFTLLGFAVEAQGSGAAAQASASPAPVVPVPTAHAAAHASAHAAAAAHAAANLQTAGGVLWTIGGLGSIVLTLTVLAGWLRTEERATPDRTSGLDPAAVAQLTAWREQRAEGQRQEAERRAAVAQSVAARRSRTAGAPPGRMASPTEP